MSDGLSSEKKLHDPVLCQRSPQGLGESDWAAKPLASLPDAGLRREPQIAMNH